VTLEAPRGRRGSPTSSHQRRQQPAERGGSTTRQARITDFFAPPVRTLRAAPSRACSHPETVALTAEAQCHSEAQAGRSSSSPAIHGRSRAGPLRRGGSQYPNKYKHQFIPIIVLTKHARSRSAPGRPAASRRAESAHREPPADACRRHGSRAREAGRHAPTCRSGRASTPGAPHLREGSGRNARGKRLGQSRCCHSRRWNLQSPRGRRRRRCWQRQAGTAAPAHRVALPRELSPSQMLDDRQHRSLSPSPAQSRWKPRWAINDYSHRRTLPRQSGSAIAARLDLQATTTDK